MQSVKLILDYRSHGMGVGKRVLQMQDNIHVGP